MVIPIEVKAGSEVRVKSEVTSMAHMYLFKQDSCVNCPAVDEIVKELEQEMDDLVVTRVDVNEMDEEMEYELALQQVHIFSTPTIVILDEKNNKFKIFSAGNVPDIGRLRFVLGVT